MRVRKVRFGVSIPQRLTEKLNKIAEALKLDRSKIVSNAISDYVRSHDHYIVEHNCRGLLIVVDASKHLDLLATLSNYSDIVRFYNHANLGDVCVDIILVAGKSSKITELHRILGRKYELEVRYVPIACNATQLQTKRKIN